MIVEEAVGLLSVILCFYFHIVSGLNMYRFNIYVAMFIVWMGKSKGFNSFQWKQMCLSFNTRGIIVAEY